MGDMVAVPVQAPVAVETESRVRKALEDFVEAVASMPEWKYAEPPATVEPEPKTWFADPFTILDHLGMGYRAQPSVLTYETLRMMSERSPLISAIHLTRITQVANFCQPQENPYVVGYKIRPKWMREDPHRLMKPYEKERVRELDHFIQHTGLEHNRARGDFETYVKKVMRDSLQYDQAGIEIVKTRGGKPHSFFCGPSDTYRIAEPKIDKGTPPAVAELKRHIAYVQVINGVRQEEFTHDELAFLVRNPRTNLRVQGYGFPELEMLMTTVTSHLYAEEWNRRAFSNGSTMKGVFNLKGNIPNDKFEGFKRQFLAQVSGVMNAWRMPILNVDGAEFLPMQNTNVEMGYQQWLEYLIKVACAIYLIDPAEINFDLRGASGQQPAFMPNNEAQQKLSKDRGLQPLLRFVQKHVQYDLIDVYDPGYEFVYAGLDAKTEAEIADLRTKQASSILTLDEARAMEGKSPLGKERGGDIVLNPTYTGYLQQLAMQKQQQQQMQAPGGGGGGAPGMPPGPQQAAPPPAGGGQPAGGQPPDDPYVDAFKKPPGPEEHDGAEKLNKLQQDEHRSDRASVHFNDWSSSSKSLPDEDLAKSVQVYDTIDIEA